MIIRSVDQRSLRAGRWDRREIDTEVCIDATRVDGWFVRSPARDENENKAAPHHPSTIQPAAMAKEIERKFRIDPNWQPPGDGVAYEQGYLSSKPERTVRVRIAGDHAKLTIKGANQGVTRAEYEYDIPLADAESLLAICEQPTIRKRRYVVEHAGKTWEVDVFAGENAGLVIAELELASEDEVFEKPSWVRDEVSDDPRYYNSNLVAKPFKTW